MLNQEIMIALLKAGSVSINRNRRCKINTILMPITYFYLADPTISCPIPEIKKKIRIGLYRMPKIIMTLSIGTVSCYFRQNPAILKEIISGRWIFRGGFQFSQG